MGKVSDAIALLQAKEANMTGGEMEALLIGLGFEVRPTGKAGHCVVTHDHLDGFLSTSFDKGHHKHMLPTYPRAIRGVLRRHREQLELLLGDKNG
jgi:hypothetical protein